jgi:pimeloyl-ACP methyl ester carboxylesterase
MTGSLPADFRPPTPSRRLAVRSADDTRLAVEIHGEPPDGDPERPTVVLAHGWTCSASFWVRVVHRLRTDLRVVVYDQRGHGRSQAVCAGGFTPDALADDLAAVLTATVPAGRPAVVAGHSMGAMSLVALAGRHPDVLRERVAGALLASTGVAELVGRVAVLPTGPRRTRRPASARSLRTRERLIRLGMTDPRPLHALPRSLARALLADLTMSPTATRAEREYAADVVLACPPPTYTGFAEMLTKLDLRQELGSFDVPALVLVGTRDRLTPPWHARRMVAALPRPLGLVELYGHGHMTPVTAPVSVSDAVRRLVPLGHPIRDDRAVLDDADRHGLARIGGPSAT